MTGCVTQTVCDVRFGVLIAMFMKIQLHWAVRPRRRKD